MEPRVYHVGYNAGNSEQQVQALMSDPKMLLIDTRLKPWSWRPTWCREDKVLPGGQRLPGLQSQWGNRYKWAGKYLGNLGYKFHTIDIADIETGLRGLRMYLQEGYALILLCQCSVVEDCHRYTILKALKAAMPEVEICSADGKPEREIA